MITYIQTLCPIYECVSFIERFVNHTDDEKRLLEHCDSEEEKAMIKELLFVSIRMKEIFQKRYAQDAFLFTFLHEEQEISVMRALLYAFSDEQQRSVEELFVYMHVKVQEDPCVFIREILSTEKDVVIREDLDQDTILSMMDEFHVTDEVKWKLWQLHRRLPELIDTLEKIIRDMLPVFHEFDALYEKLLDVYRQELEDSYPQGDMYQYVTEQLHIRFTEDQIIIQPVVSSMRSLSFLTRKRNDGSGYLLVYWGIGTVRRMRKEKDVIDVESMCSTLKLLSDRSKFDILRFISDKKAYGAQIANELHLTTPTISYHMQSLLNAKLVSVQKANNRLYYELNKVYVKELFQQIYKQLVKE